MAASDWPAGYELFVSAGGTEYGFKDVDIDRTAREIDRSNSKYSPGFEITKAGACKLVFSANGPWRDGETPLVLQGEYTWIYRPFAAHAGITFLGQIVSIKDTNDVLDGPKMSIKVVTSEDFDLNMLE